jgi:hypothetical protein
MVRPPVAVDGVMSSPRLSCTAQLPEHAACGLPIDVDI